MIPSHILSALSNAASVLLSVTKVSQHVDIAPAVTALATVYKMTHAVVPWAPTQQVIQIVEPYDDSIITEAEIGGCKALLLEIVRRAAYDWVLYRTSAVMPKRRLAEDAFEWLFNEMPGHPNWIERAKNHKDITSFEGICDTLDLDPDKVRAHVRRLTVKSVMSIGRPAEYRRQEWRSDYESYKAPQLGSSLESDLDDLFSLEGLSEEY